MRRLSLIAFLVVLMTSGAFATTYDFNNGSGDGLWSTAANWNPVGVPVDDGSTSSYYKVQTTMLCTLNNAAGNFPKTKLNVSGTTAELDITGGSIGTGNEFQISDLGKTGTVVQTGGNVTTYTGQTAGKIEIGYKTGTGYYTISGGSIGFGADNAGQIFVGGSGTPGATGTFKIVGSAATITTDKFWVGTKDASAGYPGTGTVDFELGNHVSPINVVTSVVLDNAGASSVANLVVKLTDEGVPPMIIPLIKTSSGTAVSGTFDTISGDQNGGRAAEGDLVVLSTPLGVNYTYTLTYVANLDGTANDIALVPEPATIALLGLGLLALVRKPRRK